MSEAAGDTAAQAAGASEAGRLPDSPYKGLTAYAAQDAAFFFGREDEREIIAANLVAARLTVIYGASGVGKSSLLHAGVARDLRERAERNRKRRGRPGLAVVTFSGWHDPDVVATLRRAVRDAVQALGAELEHDPSRSLADDLDAAAEAVGGEVLLIFDQFEEFFLYHPRDVGEGGFDAEFARAVTRPDLRANFLIALREDAITRLDRFKPRVPYLFDNYLRVRHLDLKAGRAAIVEPIEQFNRLAGPGAGAVAIEPDLVDRVLDEVRTGKVRLEDGGHGGVKRARGEAPEDARIETPYLQLVMTRLWDEEIAAGSRVLRLATLERLGGGTQIVRANLDDSLAKLTAAKRDIVERIFLQLVTPSGTKVAHAPADLAKYAGVPEPDMLELLEELSQGSVRILRAVADESGNAGGVRYEIFHDVLAAPILDWRRRHVAEAQRAEHEAKQREADRMRVEAEEEARSERRRARIFRGLAIAAGVFAAGVAVLAVLAVRAKQKADSQELAGRATAQLGIDPAQSVRLALQALDVSTTQPAEDALRSAIGELRVRTVFTGHHAWIYDAASSPDGRRVATAGDDGVRVWDSATGHQLAVIRGHKGSVYGVSFDAQGKRVISEGVDGTVRVSDAADGREIARLKPDAGALDADGVSLSPDGTRIVTTGPTGGGAPIWEARSGRRVATLGPRSDVWSVAFSPDGRYVATGLAEGYADVLDARDGHRVVRLSLGNSAADVTHVEFSPDGRRLLSTNADVAYLWTDWRDSASGVEMVTDDDWIPEDPHFSPDSTRIVTSRGKEAQIWSGASGTQLFTLRGHQDLVNGTTFTPDGRVVTVSQDGSARVWSPRGGIIAVLRGHRDAVTDADVSRDGRRIVTAGGDGTARVWDIADDRVLRGHREEVTHAQFSPTGRRVLTASIDGTVRVWSAASSGVVEVLRIGRDLSGAALSPDGKLVAVGTDGGRVRLRELGGRTRDSWTEKGAVGDVSFSADGRFLVSVVADADSGASVAVVRELADAKHTRTATLKGHSGEINSARFSPDGRFVVTAGVDRTARIYRASGGRGRILRGHAGFIWSATWSGDGRRVVTAGNDGTVRIWDAAGGRPVGPVLGGFEGGAKSAVFGNHGKWIVAGGGDGTTRVFDVDDGRLLAVIREHFEAVNAVDVSPSDNTILSASDDGSTRLYRCTTCVDIDALRKLAARRLRYVPPGDGG